MMKGHIIVFIIVLISFSCSRKENAIPQKVFERAPLEFVSVIENIKEEEQGLLGIENEKMDLEDRFEKGLTLISIEDSLDYYLKLYLKEGNVAAHIKVQNHWNKIKAQINQGVFYPGNKEMEQVLKNWININAELLTLSGNVKYAEEIEFAASFLGIINAAKPLIYTMDADHVYVNLFTPSSLKYEHSLGGNVHIKQETEYPKSNSVKISFDMDIKRYMEIYIRIPSWAEDAEVIVKKVKYLGVPGSYCKIAKKWKEGDIIDVRFSKKRA